MTKIQKTAKYLNEFLEDTKKYNDINNLLAFDRETICPKDAMDEHSDLEAFISNQNFKRFKDKKYIKSMLYLYKSRYIIKDPYTRKVLEMLYEDYCKNKNISPELADKHCRVFLKAFSDWQNAKKASDFSLFKDSLEAVRDVTLEQLDKWYKKPNFATTYDAVFNEYEKDITSADLDNWFNAFKTEMIPFLKKIVKSKKKIRTDFLSREVSIEQQKKISDLVLNKIGFNFDKGLLAESEHPFTEQMTKNDVRITTHYYPTAFQYSMYSCIHEGGHALFMQNGNPTAYDRFCDNKSLSKHESVSRFYENVLCSSEEFIFGIFDELKEIIPNVLNDVTPRELYEALNEVKPTLIRTEADELTYTFHIIIRYEIEQMILNKEVSIDELPEIWNKKYKEYLGITPPNDREGILQDMHWSSGFGYFPTYAIGNMLNAMYFKDLVEEEDFNALDDLSKCNFKRINKWMKDWVFTESEPDLRDTLDWIKYITDEDFNPYYFIEYLKDKYSDIYGIK
jgi:carboxypeptidase Taq